MNQLLEKYQDHILNQGLSIKTSKNYLSDVKVFARWLESKESTLKTYNRYHILKYLEYMKETLKTSTINKKINSLYHFNKFLIEKDIKESLVIFNDKDRIKITGSKEVEVFSEAEQEHLLFYLHKEDIDLRLKAVTLLLLYSGIRVSELINIKLDHVDYLLNELTIIGKGNKKRTIPLKPIAIKAIKAYISVELHIIDSKYS